MTKTTDASAQPEKIVRVRLSMDKFQKLSQVSKQNGLSNSDYLRTLIFSHLAKLFPEVRDGSL